MCVCLCSSTICLKRRKHACSIGFITPLSASPLSATWKRLHPYPYNPSFCSTGRTGGTRWVQSDHTLSIRVVEKVHWISCIYPWPSRDYDSMFLCICRVMYLRCWILPVYYGHVSLLGAQFNSFASHPSFFLYLLPLPRVCFCESSRSFSSGMYVCLAPSSRFVVDHLVVVVCGLHSIEQEISQPFCTQRALVYFTIRLCASLSVSIGGLCCVSAPVLSTRAACCCFFVST